MERDDLGGDQMKYYLLILTSTGQPVAPRFSSLKELGQALAALGISTLGQIQAHGYQVKEIKPGAAAPQPVALA
jgi:hypothetical protein